MPAAVTWQAQGPLEWIHLALHQLQVINDYTELLAQVILKGRQRIIHMIDQEPDYILLPVLTADKVQALLNTNLNWQIALSCFPGQLKYHWPADKLPTIFLHYLCFQFSNCG